MRVLRLGLGEGRTIDLHPAVSIVVGTTPDERSALRRGVSAICTGLAPGPPGLLEAHGLLLDASQDDLDLLEVSTAPAAAVATSADVDGAIPPDEAQRLRVTEQHVDLLAAERWRTSRQRSGAPADARPATAPAPGEERAAALRARISRHEARDATGVRSGLDAVRDAGRSGTVADLARLVDQLAEVGLDTADLGLPAAELVRIAEDWIDERRREADRVVGASVELAGIEEALVRAGSGAEDRWREAALAATAHAEALAQADDLRSQAVDRHAPRPSAADVEASLLARLSVHRPTRLAGAAPLVLDGVLGHLDAQEATHVLERVAGLAGAVQLIVIEEHPAVRAWAEHAGMRRAAIVEPVPDPIPDAAS